MLRAFIAFTLATIFTTVSYAAIEENGYNKERKLFLKANDLISKNQITKYKQLRPQLDNYPLAPYLDYALLLKQKKLLKPEQVNQFITKNESLPIANRLNRTWLNHLASNKRWKEYIQHYDQHPVYHTHYYCHYQVGLLNGSKSEKKLALNNARELWVVGNSQPKTCDPLFKTWMNAGKQTSTDAYERFWLSLQEGNTKLARYIDKKITNKQHKKHSKQFWKIYNNPALVSTKSLKQLPKEHRVVAAQLTYKKWYRSQPITATESWIKYRDKLMTPEQQKSVTVYMGIRLNINYHSQAIELSDKLDPTFTLSELTEVRIRNALAQENWRVVKTAIEHLPESDRSDAKWKYWSTVSEMHLNPEQDYLAQLKEVAKERSFYGFIAAEISDSPFLLNAKSSQSSKEELQQLEAKPAVIRARELFKLNRLIEANREWNLALSQMTPAEKQTAGYLAKSWGWHLQAIINAAQTKRWDHIDLRFPHPHNKLFAKHAIKNGLDLSFPVAIARQESAFLYNAQSRVGARGLMQLMPKTASATAKKHKVKYTRRSQLFTPETNITLGSAYLGDMLKKFNNNPAFAAAAYNAGPHRVNRWLKERGNLPLDVWIETIPFKETRNYVQNVLAFRVIYDRLQGRQASLLSDKQMQLLALNQNDIMPL